LNKFSHPSATRQDTVPPVPLPRRAQRGRRFVVAAGLFAGLAIAFLTLNVTREIRLLGSAQSDNVQWSLVQTQVEFLEFKQQIDRETLDVTQLRQEFDLFYSRVKILEQATVFEGLRADPRARGHLDGLTSFLDAAATIIDAPDTELIAQIPDLQALNRTAADDVRALNLAGLDLFAQAADDQRKMVARTMIQLAVAVAALIAVLTLTVHHLTRLNARIYRRERENQHTTTRMTTVMSTSLDGVIVCDAQGHILEFSPAAEDIFGVLEHDVLGRDIGSVIVPDHMRDAHEAGMERMRNQGEKRVVGKGRVKLEAKHHTGRIFPIELAIQSATTGEGEIFIAFLRDISKRVAAEAELVAARDAALAGEKLKTDFLSTMSHEIRTPLNGLLGNMNLLRDTSLDADQDRYVGHMETSGRLLMSHISDVLDITRYDAGKLNTRSEPVHLSKLLQDIVDNQNGAAAKNGTTLTWNWLGVPMDWILSDYDKLQHVMMNLIGNAVKFTAQGEVRVTVAHSGTADAADLMIKIHDTGHGMSKELCTRVFDDFVTGNTAYDRDVGGTGLGLSIAKRFVTALGGQIGVDSVEGQGSTFWVSLPTRASQRPCETNVPPPDVAPRALSVLLVEDNEINRLVAREMLQADGHTVTEACDGAQGVDVAAQVAFDVVFMDISMPVMDGRAATRAIRAGGGPNAATPIVALTANAMIEEQKEFLADGMTEILTKPLARTALRALVARIDQSAPASNKAPVLETVPPCETAPARETAPAPAIDLIDTDHIAETRAALGCAMFATLQSRFVDEIDALLQWLATQDDHDLVQVAAKAHKAAGSAAIFGTIALRDLLKSMDSAAKAGEVAIVHETRTQLPDVWAQTRTALGPTGP